MAPFHDRLSSSLGMSAALGPVTRAAGPEGSLARTRLANIAPGWIYSFVTPNRWTVMTDNPNWHIKQDAELRTALTGDVHWIIAHNEAKLNAYTAAMWQALPTLIRAAEADPNVRVIVLTGAGNKAFSAGADISGLGREKAADEARRHNDFDSSAFGVLLQSSKPTIAMIDGICFGGGCELAICCDFRIASETARFSIPAARLGVGYNARWIKPLLAVVTPAKAKEILMTGRRYDAKAALDMGLVTTVVPQAQLREETERLAAELADNAPLSMLAAKRCVDGLAHPAGCVDMAVLDAHVAACFASADYAEGRQAFKDKRRPKFSGK